MRIDVFAFEHVDTVVGFGAVFAGPDVAFPVHVGGLAEIGFAWDFEAVDHVAQ